MGCLAKRPGDHGLRLNKNSSPSLEAVPVAFCHDGVMTVHSIAIFLTRVLTPEREQLESLALRSGYYNDVLILIKTERTF